MKGRELKSWLMNCVKHWRTDKFLSQDRRVLILIFSKVKLLNDTAEVSTDFLVSIIKDILVGATPQLLALIRETLRPLSLFYHAEVLLQLKPYVELYEFIPQVFSLSKPDANRLYEFFYLVKLNNKLLDHVIVELLLKVAKENKYTKEESSIFFKYTRIDSFIDQCFNYNLKYTGFLWHHQLLNDENLQRLRKLKQYQLLYLFEQLENLARARLLDAASFSKALEKFKKKSSPKPVVTVEKISRKSSDLPFSQISCKEFSLFLDKRCARGAYGVIKRAQKVTEAFSPASEKREPVSMFAVKRYIPDTSDTEDQAARECLQNAKREARHHRLLGEEAYFFERNGKYYLAREWYHGKNLSMILAEKLITIAPQTRVEYLLFALRELAIFHQNNLIHGDIKPENCILDVETKKLRLLDFGLSHHNPYKEIYLMTEQFRDPYRLSTDFPGDMYAFGHVVQTIFPEVVSGQFQNKLSGLWVKAIQSLCDSMMGQREQRCVVEDAISYCERLIKGVKDESELQQLCQHTLKRREVTSNDISRGRLGAVL